MTSRLSRHRVAETAEQARRDLDELDAQLASGEIDEPTGRRLRATYLRELTEAEAQLSETSEIEPEPVSRSRGRMVAGALILAAGLAVSVGLVGSFVQDRDDGTLLGVAGGDDFDPEEYSNETLEAVLSSIAGDPEALRATLPMRFRLAERYFSEQDFGSAFGHYQYIVESEPDPRLGSAALTRVAWIVWVGNGLTDLALETIDQAIAADPANTEATYVKAQLLWCGLGEPAPSLPLLEQVLSDPGLGEEVRGQVETDLALVREGKGCS